MDHQESPTVSRNIVAEIIGKTIPEEVVLVSGHVDSWDVGQGAMDDGGGAYISWMSLAVLRNLGLRPRRTIRYAHRFTTTHILVRIDSLIVRKFAELFYGRQRRKDSGEREIITASTRTK